MHLGTEVDTPSTLAAYTDFLESSFAPLRGYLVRRGVALEDAENLAQDAIALAWERREGLASEPLAPRRAFLYRTAEFLAKNEQRKRARRRFMDWLRAFLAPSSSAGPGTLSIDYRRALETLDRDKREVVRLRIEEDLDFETIGLTLGIPTGTAKSRFFHGAIALRRELRDYLPGAERAMGGERS